MEWGSRWDPNAYLRGHDDLGALCSASLSPRPPPAPAAFNVTFQVSSARGRGWHADWHAGGQTGMQGDRLACRADWQHTCAVLTTRVR